MSEIEALRILVCFVCGMIVGCDLYIQGRMTISSGLASVLAIIIIVHIWT